MKVAPRQLAERRDQQGYRVLAEAVNQRERENRIGRGRAFRTGPR
jgi:hypothetical protein